jgi:hypothetical protein
LGESNIWGGRIRFDGATTNSPFQITAFSDDIYCSASTPLVGSNQRTMVAYQRNFGTDWDIVASVIEGTNVITERNLSIMESAWLFQDQRQPSVDSDGRHFLVAYLEQYASSTTDYDIYVSDYHLAGNVLGLSEAHINLAYTAEFEGTVRMASAASSGESSRRFMATWYRNLSSTNADIHAGLVDAREGGTKVPFCFGDGSSGACPCNNQGATGRGCAHSGNVNGALLQVNGIVSTANDTASLTISGAPAAALCIFVQSNDTPFATPFGDGLGCIGSGMVRLMTKTASGGVATYPLPTDISLHVRGGVPLDGGLRAYQVWYRNSAAFCTSAAFNISNGVIVNWAR